MMLLLGFAVGCTLSGLLALGLHMRHARQRRAAERYVAALCQLDPHELCDVQLTTKLPTLGAEHPWTAVFARVKDYLVQYSQRLEEAEHARACADVRAHRMGQGREQLEHILAGLSEPVLATDQYDELILANASARELFGLPVIEPSTPGSGQHAAERLIDCQPLVELLQDTRRRKTPTQRSSELELTDEGGMTRWYRVTCRSVSETEAEGSGAVAGAVAVLADISHEKAIQKRNAEFISAVSHEMKTPLAGIKAYVELLVDDDADSEETREEFLNVINSQADRLQRLIDNLLNLARIEAGVVHVDKQPYSLNELLEEAKHVVQPASEKKQIVLEDDLSPMYLGVLADRDMMLQAAINLLSNAIKYTDHGGHVTLRSRMDEGEVVFEVEDSGVGLSDEDCQRVFDKFYRVRRNREMASGTGLGLPLAKHIVEDVHGGRLTVASELGRGSVFTVALPKAAQLSLLASPA